MVSNQFCSLRRAFLLALTAGIVALASCGFVHFPGAAPQPVAATVLTNADLARWIIATDADLRSEYGKLVHPVLSDELESVSFVAESSPPCIDLHYAIAPLRSKGLLYIKSPVRGKMVWLDGHPGQSYTFEIEPLGADYFVWLYVWLSGTSATPGLSLASHVQAGGTYERGASLAVCSSISPDLHLSMGVARCKNPKDLGTVRCALPDGRDNLDPRESVYWLQGYPQFLPD